MPSIAIGVTIPRLSVHGLSAPGYDTGTDLYTISRYNEQNLVAWGPFTLSTDMIMIGASLTAGNISDVSTNDWPTLLGDYFTNSTNNQGIGGQTSGQVEARVATAAADGTENVKIASFQGGDNELDNVTFKYTSILTNHADMDALWDAIPNSQYFHIGISGSTGSSAYPINGMERYLVDRGLRAANGAAYRPTIWSLYGMQAEDSWSPADLITIYLNRIPESTSTGIYDPVTMPTPVNDDTHPNNEGNIELAKQFAWMYLGMDDVAPCVQDNWHYVDENAASGDLVYTVPVLGTVSSWSIVDGDTNSNFTINSSGEIRRSANGTINRDWYYLRVRADNGTYHHDGRIVLGRAGSSFAGSRMRRYGALGIAEPGTLTNFTLVVRMKYDSTATDDRYDFFGEGGHSYILSKGSGVSRGRRKIVLRNASDVSVINLDPTLTITDEDTWYNFGISYNQGTGTATQFRGGGGGSVSGAAVTVANVTDVELGEFMTIGTSTNNYITGVRDFQYYWLGDAAFDFTSATDRGYFFASSGGGAPVAYGTNGAVNGNTPLIAFQLSGPGDWLHGRAVGTHKDNLTINLPFIEGAEGFAGTDA